MAKTNTQWQANSKQNDFLKALAEKGSMTLRQASDFVGYEVKSGTVNTLVSKGLVSTEDYSRKCNLVDQETGEVLGTATKTVKKYSLVSKD